jgi:putative transposase
MMQIDRNITDMDGGFLCDMRFLILDRDAKYSEGFREVLVREGIDVIRLPPKLPNLNSFAERFVRSVKEECLNQMIFFGRASIRRAIAQYLAHYHCERNHQGLGNRLLRPSAITREFQHPVRRRERLGEMLSYYHHQAA